MRVCPVIANPPVPTVIETGFGTSCGVASGAAEAGGEEVMDTAYPTTATRRDRIGRVLRRRLGVADHGAPRSGTCTATLELCASFRARSTPVGPAPTRLRCVVSSPGHGRTGTAHLSRPRGGWRPAADPWGSPRRTSP